MSKLRKAAGILKNAARVTSRFGLGFGAPTLGRSVLPRSSEMWRRTEKRLNTKAKAFLDRKVFDPSFFAPEDHSTPIGKGCYLFMFWAQGIDQAPMVIQKCYKALQKNCGGCHPVLITLDNVREWVTLDPIIWQRLEAGDMDLTHFSDVLRYRLLLEHGGIWLDATMLLIRPFPEEILDWSFWDVHHGQGADWVAGGGRWMTCFMGMGKGSPLANYCYRMHVAFWEKYDTVLCYSIPDVFLEEAWDRLPAARRLLEAVPLNNTGTFELLDAIFSPFSQEQWERMCRDNFVLRLTYKMRPGTGENTFYSFVAGMEF